MITFRSALILHGITAMIALIASIMQSRRISARNQRYHIIQLIAMAMMMIFIDSKKAKV